MLDRLNPEVNLAEDVFLSICCIPFSLLKQSDDIDQTLKVVYLLFSW